MTREDNMIDEIDHLLSSFPYAGKTVEQGPFKVCVLHTEKVDIKC